MSFVVAAVSTLFTTMSSWWESHEQLGRDLGVVAVERSEGIGRVFLGARWTMTLAVFLESVF